MWKKRITAIIVTLSLLFGNNMPIVVYADETKENTSEVAADISVDSTDSFGAMLTDIIEEETEQEADNDGCNIFSIEIEGTEALVEFESNQYASLIVAVYDENGKQMIASGDYDVIPGDTEAVVEIETEQMPEFFYLRGFLVDYETFEPYCTVYESPVYMSEMQEFLKKTTDDFKNRDILNFDEDTDNNFAVYNESTVVIDEESGENDLIQSDEDKQFYVIENADETVLSLSPGDIFSYEYEDGMVLITKVVSAEKDGTTVKISGEETTLEEVFEYIKIDTEQFADSAEIDSSVCGEGVTYEGIDNTSSINARAIEGEFETSKSANLTLNKTLGGSVKLTGSLELKAGASLKLYLSLSYQYVEVKIDYSAGVNVELSGMCNEFSLPLIKITFMPLTGVFIEITPSLVLETSANITLTGTLEGCVGVAVSSDKGIKNLTRNPRFDTELKSEILVFIGLSIKPKVKLIDDNLAKVEAEATAGVELKAELSQDDTDSDTIMHECSVCYDGDITARCDLRFEISFIRIFNYKLEKEIGVKIADFYWSVDYGEFAFTTCPHITYRITVNVKDNNDDPVKNVLVSAVQVNGAHIIDMTDNYETGEDGSVVFYLPEGQYTFTAAKQEITKNKKIYIRDKAKEITIKLNSTTESEEQPEDPDYVKVTSVEMGTYFSAAILDDGSLWTWGMNPYGQLGDGTKEGRAVPKKILEDVESVSLGYHNGAAVKTDGTLWVWGDNGNGEFGDGTYTDSDVPVQVMTDVASVSVGYWHMAALKTDGSLWMWGTNGFGQLGDGTTDPKNIPVRVMEDVKQISLGDWHCAAVKNDGSLWVWGRNNYYQLGDGSTEDRNEPYKLMEDVAHAEMGRYESAVIKTDGSLWVWGNNEYTQLGTDISPSGNVETPIHVMDNVSAVQIYGPAGAAIDKEADLWIWGDKLGDGSILQDENNLIKKLVGEDIQTMSIGYRTAAMVTADGNLWTWGYNGMGQLGNGTYKNTENPVNITGMFTESSEAAAYSIESPVKSARRDVQENIEQFSEDLPDTVIPVSEKNTDEEGNICISASGLNPDSVYNLYAVKKADEENVFSDGNLLYIYQMAADENGLYEVSFSPTELSDEAIIFIAELADKKHTSEDTEIHPGDIDGNEKVDIMDLRIVLRAVCGKEELSEEQEQAADVEKNGSVDIQDLRKILRFICGKLEEL